MTFCALGLLAEQCGHRQQALDWMVLCIALFPDVPHPATGPGPWHLARLTAALGMPALEDSWRRCTGAPLPETVRTALPELIAQVGTPPDETPATTGPPSDPPQAGASRRGRAARRPRRRRPGPK